MRLGLRRNVGDDADQERIPGADPDEPPHRDGGLRAGKLGRRHQRDRYLCAADRNDVSARRAGVNLAVLVGEIIGARHGFSSLQDVNRFWRDGARVRYKIVELP